MPRWLLRVFAVLAGLGLVACLFGALAGLGLGFGADAPLPRETATVFLVVAGFGVLVFGVALWWLNQQLDRAARAEGRLPPGR